MAFTGSPVFAEVSNRVCRVTGLSLGATVAGVLGLFGDSGAVIQLPDGFQPEDYSDSDLGESIAVSFVKVGESVGNPFEPLQLSVNKSVSPFRVEVVNGDTVASGAMEIWLRFHWELASTVETTQEGAADHGIHRNPSSHPSLRFARADHRTFAHQRRERHDRP